MDDDIASLLGLTNTGTTQFLPNIKINGTLASGSTVIGGSVPEVPLDFLVTNSLLNLPGGATGILGSDFFTSVNFSLDDLLLTINPDFPVIFTGGRLLVTIPIKGATGTVNTQFVIDTGSPFTIISQQTATAAGLIPVLDPKTGQPVQLALQGGAEGNSPVQAGILNQLGFVPFVINNIKGLPPGVSGLLGLDVLDSRFTLTASQLKLTLPQPPGGTEVVPVKFITSTKVPEPSSTLSLLALGTLGAGATLKRKLKPSKSTEKETTKVS